VAGCGRGRGRQARHMKARCSSFAERASCANSRRLRASDRSRGTAPIISIIQVGAVELHHVGGERVGGMGRPSCPIIIFPKHPISIILLRPLAVPRAGGCDANRTSSRSFCSGRRLCSPARQHDAVGHITMIINNKPRKTSVTRSIFASRFYTNKGETK